MAERTGHIQTLSPASRSETVSTADILGLVLAMNWAPSDSRAIAAIAQELIDFHLDPDERKIVGEELRTWMGWQGPGSLTQLVQRIREEKRNGNSSTPGWAPPQCLVCSDSGLIQIDRANWIVARCYCQRRATSQL